MTPKEISDRYLQLSETLEKIGHLIVHDNIKKALFILGSLHAELHLNHLRWLSLHETSNNFKSKGLPNDI